jgi:hypothetical protein
VNRRQPWTLRAGAVLAPLTVCLGLGVVTASGAQGAIEDHREVFRWQDPEITESSGLAVVDGLFVTVNDSGDRGRTFNDDPETGRTVGGASWSDLPVDVEAVEPLPGGDVLVGDIGGNNDPRTTVRVIQVPVGRDFVDVDARWTDLRYPAGTGPYDAEVLLVHPVTGRVYVVTKAFEGGVVY